MCLIETNLFFQSPPAHTDNLYRLWHSHQEWDRLPLRRAARRAALGSPPSSRSPTIPTAPCHYLNVTERPSEVQAHFWDQQGQSQQTQGHRSLCPQPQTPTRQHDWNSGGVQHPGIHSQQLCVHTSCGGWKAKRQSPIGWGWWPAQPGRWLLSVWQRKAASSKTFSGRPQR